MDSSEKINWENFESHVLLNPKLPSQESQRLNELARQFRQEGHIWISSSGSSASATHSVKLIALSKKAFLASAAGVNQHLRSSREDVWVQALPRFHVGGLSIETRAYLSGAPVISGIENEKWNPLFFHKMIEQHKGSLSALVPTQVFDLVQNGLRAPRSLRAIVIGGSALGADLYLQATEMGWPLLPSYGLTECCSQVATAELDSWKSKNPEFKILPHVRAETNAEGILRIQSLALLTGYAQWVDGQALWKDSKVDGWYQTEDICEIRGNVLKPLGRGTDYVKISGEGVSLLKLQEILETCAQKKVPKEWQQVALAAIPDSRTGSRIVLAAANSVEQGLVVDLQKEFNQLVAPFERIMQCFRVPEIPRTALGKIAREKLKSSLLSQTQ